MLKALLKDVPFSTPSLVVAILSYKFDECGRSGLTFQFSEWNIKNPIAKSNCEMMDIPKTHKILHVLDELDICLDIFIIHYSPQA